MTTNSLDSVIDTNEDAPIDYLLERSPKTIQRLSETPIGTGIVDTIREGELLENYWPDIIAGNTSRTTIYALQDYFLVGATAMQTGKSALATFGLCMAGWSLVYSGGKKALKMWLGDKYNKKVENVYSGVLTAAFGIAASMVADYDLVELVSSTALRTTTSFVLGTPTRLSTDYLRNATGGEELVYTTPIKNASLATRIATGLAIATIPAAVSTTAILQTPDSIREPMVDAYNTYFVNPVVEGINAIPDVTDELVEQMRE